MNWNVKEKIFCTGPIIAAKDEQKSLTGTTSPTVQPRKNPFHWVPICLRFISQQGPHSLSGLSCMRLFQLVRVGFHDYLFPTWRAVYCLSVSVLGTYMTTVQAGIQDSVCIVDSQMQRVPTVVYILENYRLLRICTSHREWQFYVETLLDCGVSECQSTVHPV